MAYLKNNNNRVTVDAILTKYGKVKLASTGKLDIVKFAVADDEIDYALYNSDHPDGSDFYGYALSNLPTLEALPESYLSMKYPVFTQTTGILDAIAEMRLAFDANITGSGISTFTVYPITPSFFPTPGDITRIYYVAKLTIPQPVGGGGGGIEPVPVPAPITGPTQENPQLLGGTSSPAGQGSGALGTEGTSDDGTKFLLQANINPNIGITPAIIAARGYYKDTAKYKYAVGHSFTFQVTRFGRDGIVLPLTISAYGVNSRDRSINIKVNSRAVGEIQYEEETQTD